MTLPVITTANAREETAGVSEEVANGDGGLVGIPGEFGKEPAGLVFQGQFILFDELQDAGGGGYHLGQGSGVEDCVDGHGLACRDGGPLSVGFSVNFFLAFQPQYATG